MIKSALITNVPAPYRVPVFSQLARSERVDFLAVFCAERYPGSKWDYGTLDFPHVFLRPNYIHKTGEIIHNNPDILRVMADFEPDVVITTGYNPTHLYAMGYSVIRRCKHVVMSDGTLHSEAKLSRLHRIMRHTAKRITSAYLAASDATARLFESYGIDPAHTFRTQLCIDNDRFFIKEDSAKTYDVIFCGRFIESKNPMFVIEVIRQTQTRIGRPIRGLFVGGGPQESIIRQTLDQHGLKDCVIHGYATQAELPELYASARVLLFPTADDTWGIVANEASAAGLPILVTPFAGVSGELVIDGGTGFVLPLAVEDWVEKLSILLDNPVLCQGLGAAARRTVNRYNFTSAADGIEAAICFAAERG